MFYHEAVLAGYESVLRSLERTLEGLTVEDVNWQPSPDANSIGWLTWHLTRVQDGYYAALNGDGQLWLNDGWHAKFGRPANEKDVGVGHTAEDLAAFKSPDVETLLGYQRAVFGKLKQFLPAMSDADLEKGFAVPWLPEPPKIGVFLVLVLSDGLQHAGQAAYVRGLRQGKGWW